MTHDTEDAMPIDPTPRTRTRTSHRTRPHSLQVVNGDSVDVEVDVDAAASRASRAMHPSLSSVPASPAPSPAPNPFSSLTTPPASIVAEGWAVEPGGYSIDKIYPAARTKPGEGSDALITIRVQVPSFLGRMITELIHQQTIPEYGTQQDLLRDAILHRLLWVAGQLRDGRMRGRLHPLIVGSEIELATREIEQTNAMLEGMRELLRVATENRDWAAVNEAVGYGRVVMDELREPYRSEMAEVLSHHEGRDA